MSCVSGAFMYFWLFPAFVAEDLVFFVGGAFLFDGIALSETNLHLSTRGRPMHKSTSDVCSGNLENG
jgi:hypothetical protein